MLTHRLSERDFGYFPAVFRFAASKLSRIVSRWAGGHAANSVSMRLPSPVAPHQVEHAAATDPSTGALGYSQASLPDCIPAEQVPGL